MNRIKKPAATSVRQKNNSGNSVNSVQKTKRLVPLLLQWFSTNARDLPWRRTRDPYAIWVSEIMLQQTQVKTVVPYWERWLRELPSIKSLAAATPAKIHKLWEGLGYYTRVRNLQKAAQFILAEHAGKFPEHFDDVLELPGIGRYTAGAICSIAFNQPRPILDGNVIRVLTRIFGIAENPREKKTNAQLWQLAHDLVNHASRFTLQVSRIPHPTPCSHLNQSLMELGALICTPRQPQCDRCPVSRHCDARLQNRIEQLPNLGERIVATRRRFAAFVLRDKGRLLVRQRPGGVVNAHLWEFPNVELTGPHADLQQAVKSALGFSPRQLEPVCTIRHSITRYRITLDAFAIRETPDANRDRIEGSWLAPFELEKLSFPSAHKKILTALTAV
jgi:A/G-specific adenine glycosylase